ncbi:hypothetical protein L1887_55220 [Cichorium endivia]|nr:hypothetical protein L1887_55220 [Cichorium endivia]
MRSMRASLAVLGKLDTGDWEVVDDDGFFCGLDLDAQGVGDLDVFCGLDGHECVGAWDLAREVKERLGLLGGSLVGAKGLLGASLERDGLADGKRDALDLDGRDALRDEDDADVDRVTGTVAGAVAHDFGADVVLNGLVIFGQGVDGPGGVELVLVEPQWMRVLDDGAGGLLFEQSLLASDAERGDELVADACVLLELGAGWKPLRDGDLEGEIGSLQKLPALFCLGLVRLVLACGPDVDGAPADQLAPALAAGERFELAKLDAQPCCFEALCAEPHLDRAGDVSRWTVARADDPWKALDEVAVRRRPQRELGLRHGSRRSAAAKLW